MFKNVYVQRFICSVLILAILVISGCGGHHAVLEDKHQLGDEKMSCAALSDEMASLDDMIAETVKKKKSRDFWNFVEFAGGVFFIVPFFFMDTKGSQEKEIDSMKNRQKVLNRYYVEKGCSAEDLAMLSE